MIKTLLLYPAIFLFLTACGLKQPVDTGFSDVPKGSLFVSSDTIGASILLDDINMNLFTPDTLHGITVGNHIVRVFKDGFNSSPDSQIVLIEQNQTNHAHFELEKLVLTGTLSIQTTPQRAEILVNGICTGKLTPDTLTLEIGTYQIELRKNGYQDIASNIEIVRDSVISFVQQLNIQQRVLIETFANVSCEPCVEATENLHLFTSDPTFSKDQYAIIEYFGNWPMANDPFYKESPHDVDQRLSYYSIYTRGLPSMQIAGSQEVDAKNLELIKTSFTNAISIQNTPVGLSIEKQFQGSNLYVRVEVYKYPEAATIDFNQVRLFVAIVENDIHFDEAPGSNGLMDFEFVFRRFLTSSEGDQLIFDSDSHIAELEIDWPGNWNLENIDLIAFLQNIDSQQIFQSTID